MLFFPEVKENSADGEEQMDEDGCWKLL